MANARHLAQIVSGLAAGHAYKATQYVIKTEIGGVAGVIAPIIGKQPKDIQVWILGGTAPAFLKLEGQLYRAAQSGELS